MKRKVSILIGIVITLAIPLAINYLVLLPAFFPIAGNSVNWLMFWPSYLGAASSFGMIALTSYTLKQNGKQLDELKRQWEEEHRPQITAHIFGYDQLFYIRIKNISRVPILNLKILFSSDFLNQKEILNYNDWKQRITTSTFSIDPNGCLNIEIPASFFRDEHYHDTIGLHFEYNDKYSSDVTLFFDEACICNSRFEEQVLIESIKALSENVKNIKIKLT